MTLRIIASIKTLERQIDVSGFGKDRASYIDRENTAHDDIAEPEKEQTENVIGWFPVEGA